MSHLFSFSRARASVISIPLCLWLVAGPARAAATDPAQVVREFYDTLQSTMRNGPALGPKGRFQKLDPIVRRTFDIAFMTRLAVGSSWATVPSEQQRQLMDAFERYVAAIYADRFDSYSGERLEVVGQKPLSNDIVVQTRIIKSSGEPVAINYLMRRNGEDWQVSDVYLDGTISELATRRSEFSSIVRDQGITGLIVSLNRKSAFLSGTVRSAS